VVAIQAGRLEPPLRVLWFPCQEAGYDVGMVSRFVARLVPGVLVGMFLVLSSGSVGGAAVPRPSATSAQGVHRAGSTHPKTRLVIRLPQCGKGKDLDCALNLYRGVVHRHDGQLHVWSQVKYFTGHRVVFRIRRYRMNGLSLVFRNGRTDGQYSVVVVRWRHAKVGQRQRYRRSDNYAGLCWEGKKPRQVTVTIRYDYTTIGKGTSSPFRVARPWLVRAGRTGPIPDSSRLPHGVDVPASSDAGANCIPSKR
jgi:hypothetical protein